MKVVKQGKSPEIKLLSVRMEKAFLERLAAEAKRAGMKREPFVRAILEQVLADKNFVLRVRG